MPRLIEEGFKRARAREARRPRGPRERKFYQLSEAVTLFTRGMKELANYYPIPSSAISEFERAVKNGDILIAVEPGAYLEKFGSQVTEGRIVYRPGTHARIIELPASAFDEFGHLRPEGLLTLWHELTHAVRSFVPSLERLPTAYDEMATNFLADRLALLYASGKLRPRHLEIDPEVLANARWEWRRKLVFKPDMIEELFREIPIGRRAEWQMRKELLEDFARGLKLRRALEEVVHDRNKYLNLLKRTNPRLYKIKLEEEIRRALESSQASSLAMKIGKARISKEKVERIKETLRQMKLGDQKLAGFLGLS